MNTKLGLAGVVAGVVVVTSTQGCSGGSFSAAASDAGQEAASPTDSGSPVDAQAPTDAQPPSDSTAQPDAAVDAPCNNPLNPFCDSFDTESVLLSDWSTASGCVGPSVVSTEFFSRPFSLHAKSSPGACSAAVTSSPFANLHVTKNLSCSFEVRLELVPLDGAFVMMSIISSSSDYTLSVGVLQTTLGLAEQVGPAKSGDAGSAPTLYPVTGTLGVDQKWHRIDLDIDAVNSVATLGLDGTPFTPSINIHFPSDSGIGLGVGTVAVSGLSAASMYLDNVACNIH